jgi:hypothetical protein
MGICGSKSFTAEDRAAAERSRKIEKDNEDDFEKELEKIKLLLLGNIAYHNYSIIFTYHTFHRVNMIIFIRGWRVW